MKREHLHLMVGDFSFMDSCFRLSRPSPPTVKYNEAISFLSSFRVLKRFSYFLIFVFFLSFSCNTQWSWITTWWVCLVAARV